MKYEIRMYGDPVLRETSRPVEGVDTEMRTLAADMLETMYDASGIGLAAQQIGKTEAICVVDVPADLDRDENGQRMNPDVTMPLILINPSVRDPSEQTESREEGCLSFPDLSGPIPRPAEARVDFTDGEGREQTLHVRGLLARAIQHEIDHLNGILFIDKMSPIKKIALSGRLKRLKKETERNLNLKPET